MTMRRAVAALVAATALVLPAGPASAQLCYNPAYYDVPLFWPFYAAAALVGTAAAIVETPFTVLTGAPYWPGYGFYCSAPNSPYLHYPPPPPYGPGGPPYTGYGYYGAPQH